MNCSEIRRRLSDAESLDRPPLPLRPHLATCSSCRNWLIHLTELEARLPLLPIPSSNAAKNRLLEQLRQPAPSSAQHLRVVAPDLSWTPPKERGLRKLSVAFALA